MSHDYYQIGRDLAYDNTILALEAAISYHQKLLIKDPDSALILGQIEACRDMRQLLANSKERNR